MRVSSECRSGDLERGARQNINKDMAGLIVLTILLVDTLMGRPFNNNTHAAIRHSISNLQPYTFNAQF